MHPRSIRVQQTKALTFTLAAAAELHFYYWVAFDRRSPFAASAGACSTGVGMRFVCILLN